MKNALYLLLFLGLAFTSCQTTEEEVASWQVGQVRLLAGNLPVVFSEVENDSRCPEGSLCAWEGEAIVKLLINGDAIRLSTTSAINPSRGVVYNGRLFRILALTPDPPPDVRDENGGVIQDIYRLTLEIN